VYFHIPVLIHQLEQRYWPWIKWKWTISTIRKKLFFL